jgi:hypothetical protein
MWLRALFPEVVSMKRELDVGLQSQVKGQHITTHTVVWITRRNYESLASK